MGDDKDKFRKAGEDAGVKGGSPSSGGKTIAKGKQGTPEKIILGTPIRKIDFEGLLERRDIKELVEQARGVANEELIPHIEKNVSEKSKGYLTRRVTQMFTTIEKLGTLSTLLCKMEHMGEIILKTEEKLRKLDQLETIIGDKVEGILAEKLGAIESMGNTGSPETEVINKQIMAIGEKVEKMGEKVTEKISQINSGEAVPQVREQVEKLAEACAKATSIVEKVEHSTTMKESWVEVARRNRKKETKGPKVIVETSKEGVIPTKEEIVKCLNVKEGDIRVRGMRRAGKNIIIEVHNEQDLEKLKSHKEMLDKGFIMDRAPRMRMPHISIHGVDSEVRKDDLLKAVYARNKEVFGNSNLADLGEQFIPKFSKRGRNGTATWVVAVCPKIFKTMMGLGRVYVGLWACRVEEFLDPMRCYRCLAFGHTGHECSNRITCTGCGAEGHHVSSCSSRRSFGCTNCRRAGHRGENHSTMASKCPILERARMSIKRNTQYE